MKTRLLYAFLFVSTFAFAQFPTNGLVAQYGFDNGSLADGANGNNFTQTGASLTQENNRFNTANNSIDINGDYLTRPDVAFNNSRLSYNFWIKTGTNDVNKRTIIDNSTRTVPNGFNSDGYYIYIENGRLGVYATYDYTCSTVTQGVNNLSSHFVADNNWHNVTVKFWKNVTGNTDHVIDIKIDNFSTETVVDGFSNSSCSLNYSFDISSNVVIGNNAMTNLPAAYRYEDVIDDILIYNRLLTESEMSSIANYNDFCFSRQASDITVNTITETTANIVLPSTGVFDVAYALKDVPFSSAIIISNITTGSTPLSGLTTATFYDVYLREHCATSTSGWSVPKSFKTARPYGRLYVNKNATGANDGLTWADAFTDLQSALADVFAGEEIWITSGTYKPHASNRGVYYVINKENMKIYGGFSGTETQLSERVLGANETILSADLQENDANISDFPGNYSNTTRNADNSYRVVNILDTGNNLLLDGLTISDAHNNASATSRGAAIAKNKSVSQLTLRNCIIKDNLGRNDNAGLVAEFELNNTSGTRGELIIENCKFINNMSRWASGIYSFVRGNTNVDITVANTLFDGNIAADLNTTSATGLSGSASWFRVVTNGSNVTLNLSNNTYVNNQDLGTAQSLNNFNRATAGISKGAGITSVFNATVNNCIFWNNTSAGGVTARSITDLYKSPANSLIINNSIDSLNFNDDSITSTVSTSNADPVFISASTGDFTLNSSSPAVDTGDNTYAVGGIDLSGNPRIFNSLIDMGAFEYNSTLSTIGFELNDNQIKLYPNPTSSVLNIEINASLKQAKIYSVLGTQVLKTISKTINISTLNSGIYLIKIEDENGSISTKRFVKN
ncbi:MAG: hypothetical protein ACJA1H_002545 [Glaciecola sp.]|jgi:hypothetical protein